MEEKKFITHNLWYSNTGQEISTHLKKEIQTLREQITNNVHNVENNIHKI